MDRHQTWRRKPAEIGAAVGEHVDLPCADAPDRCEPVGDPLHGGRRQLEQLAGGPVHGDRNPGHIHLPDRRAAEHQHAHPVALGSRRRRAGLPADDRNEPRHRRPRELRDSRRERHQLPRAGAPDRQDAVCPGRVGGGRQLERLSGRVFHRRSEPRRVHPPNARTDRSQQPDHIHLEHQSGRDRLPTVGRDHPRLRRAAQIRVTTGQHILLHAAGAPRRPDAVGPDLYRGQRRLGQLAGHLVHHRRAAARRP